MPAVFRAMRAVLGELKVAVKMLLLQRVTLIRPGISRCWNAASTSASVVDFPVFVSGVLTM